MYNKYLTITVETQRTTAKSVFMYSICFYQPPEALRAVADRILTVNNLDTLYPQWNTLERVESTGWRKRSVDVAAYQKRQHRALCKSLAEMRRLTGVSESGCAPR